MTTFFAAAGCYLSAQEATPEQIEQAYRYLRTGRFREPARYAIQTSIRTNRSDVPPELADYLKRQRIEARLAAATNRQSHIVSRTVSGPKTGIKVTTGGRPSIAIITTNRYAPVTTNPGNPTLTVSTPAPSTTPVVSQNQTTTAAVPRPVAVEPATTPVAVTTVPAVTTSSSEVDEAAKQAADRARIEAAMIQAEINAARAAQTKSTRPTSPTSVTAPAAEPAAATPAVVSTPVPPPAITPAPAVEPAPTPVTPSTVGIRSTSPVSPISPISPTGPTATTPRATEPTAATPAVVSTPVPPPTLTPAPAVEPAPTPVTPSTVGIRSTSPISPISPVSPTGPTTTTPRATEPTATTPSVVTTPVPPPAITPMPEPAVTPAPAVEPVPTPAVPSTVVVRPSSPGSPTYPQPVPGKQPGILAPRPADAVVDSANRETVETNARGLLEEQRADDVSEITKVQEQFRQARATQHDQQQQQRIEDLIEAARVQNLINEARAAQASRPAPTSPTIPAAPTSMTTPAPAVTPSTKTSAPDRIDASAREWLNQRRAQEEKEVAWIESELNAARVQQANVNGNNGVSAEQWRSEIARIEQRLLEARGRRDTTAAALAELSRPAMTPAPTTVSSPVTTPVAAPRPVATQAKPVPAPIIMTKTPPRKGSWTMPPDAEVHAREVLRNKMAELEGVELPLVAPAPAPMAPVPAAENLEEPATTPSRLSKTKRQQLDDLLRAYIDDRIEPHEYHQSRARILAEPE